MLVGVANALCDLYLLTPFCFVDSEAAIFRNNSTQMRFLSAFAKLYGYNYLRSLIGPLLRSMSDLPPGASYEIDPNKVQDKQQLDQNLKLVQLVAESFFQVVTSSVPAFPS